MRKRAIELTTQVKRQKPLIAFTYPEERQKLGRMTDVFKGIISEKKSEIITRIIQLRSVFCRNSSVLSTVLPISASGARRRAKRWIFPIFKRKREKVPESLKAGTKSREVSHRQPIRKIRKKTISGA